MARDYMCRRNYLIGCISAFSLSGCLSDSSPPPGLRQIDVVNLIEGDVTLNISVEKNGRGVYDENISLGPTQEANSRQIIESWMGDRVPYEVVATRSVDGEQYVGEGGSDALQIKNGSASCFRLLIVIDNTEIKMGQEYYQDCEI